MDGGHIQSLGHWYFVKVFISGFDGQVHYSGNLYAISKICLILQNLYASP